LPDESNDIARMNSTKPIARIRRIIFVRQEADVKTYASFVVFLATFAVNGFLAGN